MKVFITGCARSGTTMMLYLMRYFFDTDVLCDEEYSPVDLPFTHYGKRIVFKKPQLQMNNKDYVSLSYALENCLVIYMIRNPLDILVSKHVDVEYYVHPERLIDCYVEMLKNIEHNNLHIVRYENLVDSPGPIIDKIGKFINATYSDDYLNFYKGMRNENMITGITPRPIDKNSIDNYKKEEHKKYIENIFHGPYGKKIYSIMLALGYRYDD